MSMDFKVKNEEKETTEEVVEDLDEIEEEYDEVEERFILYVVSHRRFSL